MAKKRSPIRFSFDDSPAILTSAKEYERWSFELQVYRTFGRARDIPELRRMLHEFLQKLGFSDYSFVQMDQIQETETQLYTTPDEISRIYTAEGIWEHDQALSRARISHQTFFQSDIDAWLRQAEFKTLTIEKNELIQKHVKGAGFIDYYNIPCPATHGKGNVMLSITSKNVDSEEFRRRVEKKRGLLGILCEMADYIGTIKFPEYFVNEKNPPILIAPKPLQLLKVLDRDLTLQEAAKELKITRSTANAHVAAIKRALETKTIWGSVSKAKDLGLITKY